MRFLKEQQTKLYKWYCLGVAQLKNVLGAKSTLLQAGFAWLY